MPITALFESVNAPLANARWSWGGLCDRPPKVFMRVWQDETKLLAGKRYVRLVNHAAYATDRDNLGYRERLRHLDAAKSTHVAYAVMCRAVDVSARPRAIASYDARDVFALGAIVEIDGDDWGEMTLRIPVRSLA